jgi:hypothetical protein
MESVAANAIGVLLYPLVWAQFAKARKKWQFLVINFLSCLVFAASFALAGAMTPAWVSMAAGVTSLAQAVLEKKHYLFKQTISLASIVIALMLAFPQNAVGWVAAASYAWVRVAESSKEGTMRVMYIASPAVWAILSLHAGNYTLIPVDVIALILAIRWVVQNKESSRGHNFVKELGR